MTWSQLTAAPFAAAVLMALPFQVEAQAPPVPLPVDSPQTVAGVDVACTGIGSDMRNDPRWAGYSVRVELSNARNEYLAGGAVGLRDVAGRQMLNVTCDAPWVLMRLPPGAYRVDARMLQVDAAPRSASFRAPAAGQLRVVLQFRDL